MTGFDSLAGLALLLVRPSMLVMTTPFFGGPYAPTAVRVGMTLLLALMLAPFVVVPTAVSAGGLVLIILREAGIGFALALAIRILVYAADFAGQFTGYQIGLSLGSLIDPQSGVRNNLVAVLYSNLTIVLCLATNVHHVLLRALADSYAALPIGLGSIGPSLAASVSRVLGLVFIFGVRLAAPVIVVLLLVELALALVARVAPSLNVMVAGAPVRLIVGLVIVAATAAALPSLLARLVPAAFEAAAGTAQALR